MNVTEYVPRERLDRMSSHVITLSNALLIVTVWLVASLSLNVWQSCSPSYSNADRAQLTKLIDHLNDRL